MRIIITILALWTLAAPVAADGLGWRVHDSSGNHAYLIGTLHAATESFYPLPAEIDAAFADAEVLVLEVDITRVDQAEVARIARERGRIPGRHTLRDMVSPDGWTKVAQWSHRLGVPESNITRLQPWLAAITLIALEMRRIGFAPELGMERHLAERAVAHSKPIVELESLRGQLEMLAGLSEPTQVAFLEQSLTSTEDFAESVDRILQRWTAGDAEEMAAILSESFDGHEELYDVLMRSRNHRWLPEVEAMIASGRVHFVAVGSLHLVGDDGLVELLRGRGYSVESL